MGIKTDDFRRAMKDCGPGGWKCSCCGPAEGSKRFGRRAARHRLKMNIKNELETAEIDHDDDLCDEFVACVDYDCGDPDCLVCNPWNVDDDVQDDWSRELDKLYELDRDPFEDFNDDFLEEMLLE